MSVHNHQNGHRTGDEKRENRVSYRRIDKNGNITTAEIIPCPDGGFRFQETDGWELVPWEFQPGDAEFAFAVGLLRRGARSHENAPLTSLCQLDEEVSFELLSEPAVFSQGFSVLREIARDLALQFRGGSRFFSLLEDLQRMDQTGRVLLEEFFRVRQEVGEWAHQVEQLNSASRTFDSRAGSDLFSMSHSEQ